MKAPNPKLLRSGRVLNQWKAITFGVLTVAVGILVVRFIFAAGSVVAFEPEAGTLSGAAHTVATAGASGGLALQFGDVAASPAPTPTPTAAPTPTPAAGLSPATSFVPAGYGLAWNDEFNGSAVDTAKWNIHNNTNQSYSADEDTARPQNVFLQNGILTLRALKESYLGHAYTSGYLDTIGKKNFGVNTYYEIRAKTPTQPNTSAGMWPAFWLRSNETLAETDIAEWYGNPQPADPRTVFNKATITVHSDTNGGTSDSHVGYDAFLPSGQAPWSAYHTYGCLVSTDGYRFYIDGVLVKTMLLSNYPWMSAGLGGTWNIKVNLQVGLAGKWAGAPDANTIFPADYNVDYVRIYHLGS